MIGFIFDLDGTLYDSLEDMANSLNIVLERKGLSPHPLNAYKKFVGNGMPKLVERALKDHPERYDEIFKEFLEEYAKRYDEFSRPYDGILAMLKGLQDEKHLLAVCTNKQQVYTDKIVEKFYKDTDFIAVVGDRSDGLRKPDPHYPLEIAKKMALDPKDIYFVGDSDVDMQTAKNSGMIAVGVSWGFRSVEELKAAGADYIIDSPLALLDGAFLK